MTTDTKDIRPGQRWLPHPNRSTLAHELEQLAESRDEPDGEGAVLLHIIASELRGAPAQLTTAQAIERIAKRLMAAASSMERTAEIQARSQRAGKARGVPKKRTADGIVSIEKARSEWNRWQKDPSRHADFGGFRGWLADQGLTEHPRTATGWCLSFMLEHRIYRQWEREHGPSLPKRLREAIDAKPSPKSKKRT